MAPPPLVVVIVGPTGSGKTRLAIDLARALGGDVVNADALQMHRALPICTARVRDDETRGVRHHLLGFVEQGDSFDVREFVDRAGTIVREVVGEGRSVVVAGGTNYYAQALVSDSLVDLSDGENDSDLPCASSIDNRRETEGRRTAIDDGTVDADAGTAHARLAEVDPESAKRLHPNDVRRVRRYLEIYKETGRPPSEIFKERRTMRTFRSRFDSLGCRTVFIALRCDSNTLDRVLRHRVESMVERGLVRELEDFARAHGIDERDDARGDVRQAIGYAEWKTFLRAQIDNDVTTLTVDEVDKLRTEAIESTILNTCRLAKRQQARVQTFVTRYGWPVKYVDSTLSLIDFLSNMSRFEQTWQETVVDVALEACECVRNSIKYRQDTDPTPQNVSSPSDEWTVRRCECCDKTLRGDVEWRAHVSGRRHRKVASAARKRQKGEFGHRHPSRSVGLSEISD